MLHPYNFFAVLLLRDSCALASRVLPWVADNAAAEATSQPLLSAGKTSQRSSNEKREKRILSVAVAVATVALVSSIVGFVVLSKKPDNVDDRKTCRDDETCSNTPSASQDFSSSLTAIQTRSIINTMTESQSMALSFTPSNSADNTQSKTKADTKSRSLAVTVTLSPSKKTNSHLDSRSSFVSSSKTNQRSHSVFATSSRTETQNGTRTNTLNTPEVTITITASGAAKPAMPYPVQLYNGPIYCYDSEALHVALKEMLPELGFSKSDCDQLYNQTRSACDAMVSCGSAVESNTVGNATALFNVTDGGVNLPAAYFASVLAGCNLPGVNDAPGVSATQQARFLKDAQKGQQQAQRQHFHQEQKQSSRAAKR